MIELTQSFGFEAAHTLARDIDAESSARIHGHSYTGVLILRGEPDPSTGMLVDLGSVAATVAALRDQLDHRLLDRIEGLGAGTMENLAAWIFGQARRDLPALARVTVRRDSLGQTCSYEPGCRDDPPLADPSGTALSGTGRWGVAKR